MNNWIAQVKGDPNGSTWEISVVRENNEHGRVSWGWFDENKLLISHNGGPCQWPLIKGLGPLMVRLAYYVADYMNKNQTNELPEEIIKQIPSSFNEA